ncbi:protein of unknown function [Legionella longbeachae NSW150]|uniref:Uncharacterized protein n=1 Tax=Legionella longbeachae serogroup 1 (strain NSW150) TaxID=661367 RepID=D3HMA5_LEGLN|nr:protein of unknown function [Legionella longbeachae NSW150]
MRCSELVESNASEIRARGYVTNIDASARLMPNEAIANVMEVIAGKTGTTVDKNRQTPIPKIRSSSLGLESMKAPIVNKYGYMATSPHFQKKEP